MLHDDVPGWLERVIGVATFLAERDAPVAPPTDRAAQAARSWKGPIREVVDAYGEDVDPAELDRFGEVLGLHSRIWRAWRDASG